jgi:putative peptidoglycan lipid II flippase
VAQVSLVINTHIASRLAEGSVSWLSFADRLMEFPTALLGVALGTVLLPSLTRAHSLNDPTRVSQLIDWGLRLVVLLALPATVGLALLAPGLTSGLFHYGAFDLEDLSMTAYAMQGYAIGLLGLIAVKVLAPGFYAQQDIKTPVKIALATLVLTQLLNLGLVPLMGHAGLAVATSLAACFNAGLLLVRLRQRGTYRPEPGWAKLLLKFLIAALVMAWVLFWLSQPVNWGAEQARPFLRLGMLFGLITLAVMSYFAVLRLLGMPLRSMMRPPSVD